mmetsp:Transcript_13026/g.33387  ORF Transcript_13026/g.33387 Transcript_13026/m.33387 type:complete len:295 (-) Transcript_13026:595-1479(-)
MFGMVSGSLADGLTAPKRMSATACPACCPGKKLISSAATLPDHGMSTAPGTESTTTQRGLAAATATMSAFCLSGALPHWVSSSHPSSSESDTRSRPSELNVPAKTIVTSAASAAFTAASMSSPASKVTLADGAAALMPFRGLTIYDGTTAPEPPPWVTAASPARPMTAMEPVGGNGSSPPSFLSITVEAAANFRADATDASVVTLALSFFQSHASSGSSMTPTAKSVRRMRWTASCRPAGVSEPSASLAARELSLTKLADGISMSRPAITEAECVAPQSDMTKPLKPRLLFRSP